MAGVDPTVPLNLDIDLLFENLRNSHDLKIAGQCPGVFVAGGCGHSLRTVNSQKTFGWEDDCIAETRWRLQGNYCRGCVPQDGCPHHRQAVCRAAHIVQALNSMDENATLLSIDGVGAYDSISRRAMFRGLADMMSNAFTLQCRPAQGDGGGSGRIERGRAVLHILGRHLCRVLQTGSGRSTCHWKSNSE